MEPTESEHGTDNQDTSSNPAKPTLVVGRPKGSVIDLTEDDDDVQGSGNKSPQSSHNSGGNPETMIQHCAPVESPVKSCSVTTSAVTRASALPLLPPLPAAPQPVGRLLAEATQTSPPQQLQLKVQAMPDHLEQQRPGEVLLKWWVAHTDPTCAAIDVYQLYALRQDNANANNATQSHWVKLAEFKALALPMCCTLAQVHGHASTTYHFTIRARDIYGRFGPFCGPQCAVIAPNCG